MLHDGYSKTRYFTRITRNPNKIADLEKWKHLYRALEKLTEGEAFKVISTVADENGFEAWRQLHLRFEPQLQAQKNTTVLRRAEAPPRAQARL